MGWLPARFTSEKEGEKHSSISSPPAYPAIDNPVDPSEMEGKTLLQRKYVLINHEMDRNGMGRYQIYIWFLCGFGFLIDIMWAQAFGLVLQPLEQEMGFPGDESGNISVAFSSGLTAGAFVWGVLVDIIGRQWAFNLTCLISACFGLGLGGATTYDQFLVITAFIGFGVGGNIPIDTTICLEFIPQNRRFLLALLSIFQPIGVVVTSAIAFGYIPTYSCTPNFTADDPLPSCNNADPGEECCGRGNNMGWRYLMLTIGAVTLTIFFLRFVVFRFKESPKFLVYRGQDEKAIAVLQYIANFNKRECALTMADFEALTDDDSSLGSGELLGTGTKQLQQSFGQKLRVEFQRYGMLFAGWNMTRITVLVWLTYICDFWGFTLAGYYLPSILLVKNGDLGLTLEDTYRNNLAIYTPGIVGVVLGSMMYGVPAIGRKWTMVVSSGLMGISILVYSTVNDEASNIGLNMMEYFFQSMFNAVLYGWTPEVFPAPIRGTACGVASFWGRLFGIIAPLTTQQLIPAGGLSNASDSEINNVLYVAGGITMGCVIFIALLPNKTVGSASM
ncbi:hypothetical protein MBLNU230_g3751t1 [Neophaeotheca triangularis]